jgi:hypothetical protein
MPGHIFLEGITFTATDSARRADSVFMRVAGVSASAQHIGGDSVAHFVTVGGHGSGGGPGGPVHCHTHAASMPTQINCSTVSNHQR